MTLDYDDFDAATRAHGILKGAGVKATFFPNKRMSAELRRGGQPKFFHRIVINNSDADRARELLTAEGLVPPQ